MEITQTQPETEIQNEAVIEFFKDEIVICTMYEYNLKTYIMTKHNWSEETYTKYLRIYINSL